MNIIIQGGQKLTRYSPLGFLHTTTGHKYVIYRYVYLHTYTHIHIHDTMFVCSCIKGILLEINQSLLTDPNLIINKVCVVVCTCIPYVSNGLL